MILHMTPLLPSVVEQTQAPGAGVSALQHQGFNTLHGYSNINIWQRPKAPCVDAMLYSDPVKNEH